MRAICSNDECTDRVVSKGLCYICWNEQYVKTGVYRERMRRYGKTQKGLMYRMANRLGAYHNPVKKPCFFCGVKGNVERHHPDYTRPKEIVWLCHEHHLYVHGNTEIIYPLEITMENELKHGEY